MLVPLTQSLYAPGSLGDTGKVLIDIGTGYFVEVRRANYACSPPPASDVGGALCARASSAVR